MSILPEKKILKCPSCSCALLFAPPPRYSNNSIEKIWTDGVINNNSHGTYMLVRCPICNVFFRPGKVEVIKIIIPAGINQTPTPEHNVPILYPLEPLEFAEAIESGVIVNMDEELNLRIVLWRKLNNWFRHMDKPALVNGIQEVRIRNMQRIVNLITNELKKPQQIIIGTIIKDLKGKYQQKRSGVLETGTIKIIGGDLQYWIGITAEIYRELSDFQTAIEIASIPFPESNVYSPDENLINKIKVLAQGMNSEISRVYPA